MKAMIGAHRFRRVNPKQRAFPEYSENYVAEPDVKILIEKLYRRSQKEIR